MDDNSEIMFSISLVSCRKLGIFVIQKNNSARKEFFMEKRIGVIGIIVEEKEQVQKLNELLSQYGHLIMGRMGIPHHGKINVISLIVEGNNDEIGALTGKLGALKGIMVRSALTNYTVPEEK